MTEQRLIDARGPRFAAAVTAIVLAITLIITPSVAAVVLLVVQALAFGAAAFMGMRYQPYGWFFRRVVAPRLGPAKDFEDPAPPRFAQTVGLLFVVVALVGLSFTLTLVAQIAIGFALAAAFLNAVFKFCLGCEVYLLFRRVRTRRDREARGTASASSPSEAADPDVADQAEVDEAEQDQPVAASDSIADDSATQAAPDSEDAEADEDGLAVEAVDVRDEEQEAQTAESTR